MPVTNDQILAAITRQSDAITKLAEQFGALSVAVGRLEAWSVACEKRINGVEGDIDTLRGNSRLQSTILAIGELILAGIAFLKGGGGP